MYETKFFNDSNMFTYQVDQRCFTRENILENIDLPSVLYKYRFAENPIHRTLTKKGSIFFTSPLDFDDKFDCHIPIRYDLLTEADIYNYYYKYVDLFYKRHFKLPQQIHEEQCNIYAKTQLKMYEKDKYSFYEFLHVHYQYIKNNHYGVLSLTENCSNLKMWDQYACSLNGFCIGMNTRLLVEKCECSGGEVGYYNNMPILKPLMAKDTDWLNNYKQIMYKDKQYNYEQEYRLFKVWEYDVLKEQRCINLDSSSFETLIIGENMKCNIKNEIIYEIKNLNSNIQIHFAKLIDNKVIII